MDYGNDYIKQCEKAVEIQPKDKGIRTRTPFKDGDMFSLRGKVYMYDSCSHSEGFIEPEIYDPQVIWLPRQDQLQEMIPLGEQDAPASRIVKLVAWLSVFDKELAGVNLLHASMEQLTLAFVMKENHNKVWSIEGEDWILSENEAVKRGQADQSH